MASTQQYIGNPFYPARYFAAGYWPVVVSVTPVNPVNPNRDQGGMGGPQKQERHRKLQRIRFDDNEVLLILTVVFPTTESCQH
jgi:hypothetical protein